MGMKGSGTEVDDDISSLSDTDSSDTDEDESSPLARSLGAMVNLISASDINRDAHKNPSLLEPMAFPGERDIKNSIEDVRA